MFYYYYNKAMNSGEPYTPSSMDMLQSAIMCVVVAGVLLVLFAALRLRAKKKGNTDELSGCLHIGLLLLSVVLFIFAAVCGYAYSCGISVLMV